mgnify:FL=1
METVSVPFRGLIFFNKLQRDVLKFALKVSVPFRGLIFFNNKNAPLARYAIWFPSPFGDLSSLTNATPAWRALLI